jgi:Protein of unknown function (DUF2490).
MHRALLAVVCLSLCALDAQAQFDEDELGAWYMFMWTKNPAPDSQWGLQGDVQHRNWDRGGDLEQLLVRGGLTWTPEGSRNKYTFGVAHVTSGAYGPSDAKTRERRLYQEALIPQTWGERAQFTHRFRLEQRDLDGQSTRNRIRYFLGLNYPLNQATLAKGAVYVALYNEIFFNLEQDIGKGRQVDYFDRNRAYAALGYGVADRSRVQFGYMHQRLDELGKGQLQLSWVQTF